MTRWAIVVRGPVGPLALDALEGFEVTESTPGRVRLVGTVADEAALHGALHSVQDHRLELLRVDRLAEEGSDGPRPCG